MEKHAARQRRKRLGQRESFDEIAFDGIGAGQIGFDTVDEEAVAQSGGSLARGTVGGQVHRVLGKRAPPGLEEPVDRRIVA